MTSSRVGVAVQVGISRIDVLKNGVPLQVTSLQDAYEVAFASATGYEYLGRHFDQVLRHLNWMPPQDLLDNRDDIHSVLHLMGLERAVRMIGWLRKHAPDPDVAAFWERSEQQFRHELTMLQDERTGSATDRSRRGGRRHLRLVPTM